MHKLLGYSFFLFLDKGLAFSLPLALFYLTSSKDIYSSLEAALAFSVILIPILDFGVKTYVGYIFTIKGEGCFGDFDTISLKLLFIVIGVAGFFLWSNEIAFIYIMAILRSAHINIYQYSQIKGRLTDHIIEPVIFSVFVSLVSLLLSFVLFDLGLSSDKVIFGYFTIPPFLFLLYHLYASNFSSKDLLKINLNFGFYWSMLKFSAPVIINSLLIVGFSNLTKVYVLNEFGQDAMVKYSFVFRAAMVIQLFHMTVVGYFTKFLLTSNNLRKLFLVYSSYVATLIIVTFCILLFVGLYGHLINPELLSLDYLYYYIFGHVLLWCFSSFFDVVYVRIKKTFVVLINSLFFFGTYFIFYISSGVSSPEDSALGLFFSSMVLLLSNLFFISLNIKLIPSNAINK